MSGSFSRVLVANRGEIALRIIRACHELGLEAVAVYSDADASAAHVRAADLAVRVGPADPTHSYLRIDALVEVALATDCGAVHPGYGFLSERQAFAGAVEAAGLVFVGPRSETLGALGDKLAARRLARQAGVPIVPGTLEPAAVERPEQADALLAEAIRIGFPLLVKASAGGGGRGMRRVDDAADLASSLVVASREAEAAFGDGAVYLERLVGPARHVEVQLVGDSEGTVVAVGERDCSLQRRHQKLIEEAPAPGLAAWQRRAVHEMAVKVAREAGLRNLATAEFLYDEAGRFWFLEVNTRLQVEHGVTELVTGLDLVHEQLRIAAGEPLSAAVRGAASRAAAPVGHAIEARLSAEDPARGFTPTPGRVSHWRMPSGPGVRVDTALEEGDVVPSEYDPLVAKLLVFAEDRETALARLSRAAAEVEVGGIQTTLPFIRFAAGDPSFAAGDLSTDWVAGHWDGARERQRALRAAQLAAGLDVLERLDTARLTGGRGSGDGRAGPVQAAWIRRQPPAEARR
ncbi:MAG TPA: biotin carboxylase N-terminal domain-containing protein [Candidatus Limnocylindrales bacterium]